jgi:ParB family chromosome partitioning protein
MVAQNFGLGRGLASLIPQGKTTAQQSTIAEPTKDFNYFGAKVVDGNAEMEAVAPVVADAAEIANVKVDSFGMVEQVDVTRITPNPHQPRIRFNENALQELTDSIKEYGVIQPLVVTKNGNLYEIIAGERRFQASKRAGLKTIPVIVREATEQQKLEMAIIENVQRHDLDPIEEAKSYVKLADEFNLSQEEVARKTGKSRSVIANKERLLKLPAVIQKALIEGTITEGHAKAILAVSDSEKQLAIFDMIIKQHLNVRQVEDKTKEVSVKAYARKTNIDPQIKAIEDRLVGTLGTKVKLSKVGLGGKIVIEYYSQEELDNILTKIA